MRPWRVLWALSLTYGACGALDFRPPAIPLITTDPFTQAWMFGDTATSAHVTHWDGAEKQMVGYVTVDGEAFQFLGDGPEEPPRARQVAVRVLPTRTIFEFDVADGAVRLTVMFLSTMFTHDFVRLSRPVYYVDVAVSSRDGHSHDVRVYLDASAQHTVDRCGEQAVRWSSWVQAAMRGVRMGNAEQHVVGSRGDRANIDWGHLYLAVPAAAEATALWAGSGNVSRASFLKRGALPTHPDVRQPRKCADDLPVLSTAADLGTVVDAHHTVILAYDDVRSVNYFGDHFAGLWTRTYPSIHKAMSVAAREFEEMRAASAAHDDALMVRLSQHGEKYAAVCSLAYRQALAATKLVWNHNRSMAWNFLKEISTNGDMQTMDVIYPASPMLLYTEPELLKLLLLPVLAYANNETYVEFTDPFSPHQLGIYPIADADTSAQEPMPLENTGNMFLMLLGIVQAQAERTGASDVSWFFPTYWPLLTRWADELGAKTQFPDSQICTDDFTGPLRNNTNLGAKGIVALQAFSRLCSLVRAADPSTVTDCHGYAAMAARYAQTWQRHAHTTAPAPHYKMSFNNVESVPDSWSLKYNLLWQKLLVLGGPFPWDEVVSQELEYYKRKSNAYGVPLDPRHTYVKTDWLSWIAAMAATKDDFNFFFDPIFASLNATVDRVPFTDLYDTLTARLPKPKVHFVARPVIGGLFAKALLGTPQHRII